MWNALALAFRFVKPIDFYVIFLKIWRRRLGKSKKKKSPHTQFFSFVGILWGRKEWECSWFGSKPYFDSLKRKNQLGRSCRGPARFCSLTSNKSESQNDFDYHDCAFEDAFDECTQLYIQLSICIPHVHLYVAVNSWENMVPWLLSTENVSEDRTVMLKCSFESIFQNTAPISPLGLVSAIVVKTFGIGLEPPPPWCETQVSPSGGFVIWDYRMFINNEHTWSWKCPPPPSFLLPRHHITLFGRTVLNEIRAPSIKEKHFDGEFSSPRLRYLTKSHAQNFSSANSSCLACEVGILWLVTFVIVISIQSYLTWSV